MKQWETLEKKGEKFTTQLNGERPKYIRIDKESRVIIHKWLREEFNCAPGDYLDVRVCKDKDTKKRYIAIRKFEKDEQRPNYALRICERCYVTATPIVSKFKLKKKLPMIFYYEPNEEKIIDGHSFYIFREK
ncbi:hypothetical protein [Gottfriedia acidiceleris]|uniref:hypothetical protein n=1 Tax=Gottfriedia acidiceleris TaxID=371036 RepID=UPI002FFF4C27